MKIKYFILVIIFCNSVYAARVSNFVEPVKYHVNHTKDLRLINDRLKEYNRVSLVGVSGIGKTQLSRMYTTQNKNKYDLIWFFDCSSDLSQQFLLLAQAINKNIIKDKKYFLPEEITESKNAVIKYLQDKKSGKSLIVADNIQDNKNEEIPFLNWSHQGDIIFCSQNDYLLPNTIKIPYLSDNASKKLIKNILPNLPEDFSNSLSKELKGYPITIANSSIFLLSNQYVTAEEYLTYIKKSSDNMDAYINTLLDQLNKSTKNLLYKIIFLNNQNLSKSLIKMLSNRDSFVDDLINLNRYQILSLKYQDKDRTIFELHDKLKSSLIKNTSKDIIKKIVSDTVDDVNGFIPKGKNTKQELVLSDDTMIASIEELLKNAEAYNINQNKILELKKNLMSFYLGMGVTRCQDLANWLFENEEKIILNKEPDHTMAVYAEFLVLIGVYDYFINANYLNAMKNLHKAEGVIEKLNNYEDLYYLVYSQLAQAYVFNAEMEKALYYIEKAKNVDVTSISTDFDTTLLMFIESKYFLSKGEYQKSLLSINKFINVIKNHEIDYYFAPVYVMKATILNYIKDYDASYKITKDIYDREVREIASSNAGGIRLRVIIELSRAELGLNLLDKSLEHANQAISVYKNDSSRKNQNLNESSDTDLADAFIAQADALNASGETLKALESYSIAESIYYNKYKSRINSLDEISVMYRNAAFAAHRIKNKYWFDRFKKRHIDKFGLSNARSKEIMLLADL